MTADPIIAALQEQLDCYQRLAKLAELQHEHVQQNHTEELLDVLRRRQEVLDQVNRLEEVIGPEKKRWGGYLATLPAGSRASAERLLGETRRLLEQITTADRNDALVLQQRKLNVGKQIKQATAARQINRNYAAAAYGARTGKMDVQT
ncbi:MAG TPA: hypothetical protein VIL86_20185 [Tepidisphaeraceae bacterium]|jgi:hypothetical protein